ncbi:MAG: stage II sporulation protein M [Saprospiraceae bacterium]|nr:stage II sporulation protein M [Saprospiraceae bacterium]
MRETAFIEQNQQKWQEFEQLLEGKVSDPEKLNELFVHVTDDLSFARTFYPNRSVRVYLNDLAQRIFSNIYKNKKSRRSAFVAFWLEDLPKLIHESRIELRLALFVFSLSMAVGMLSSWAEPDFVRSILSDSYVSMTEENIESGDPMAVYKEAGEFNMFLGITLNNIFVAFITFVLGLFFGVGSIGALIFNGVMVGAFQYFFIEKGLFQSSFLTICMHGAVEISSIVVAGGAGLTLGRGLAFPGTLSRERSVQLAARRGMSLMLGIVPLFIFAGFVESYVTRHTETPDWLRAVFIAVCFGFMLFYFAFNPWWKARKGHFNQEEDVRLTPDAERRVDFTQVKTSGSLFTDAFIFIKKSIGMVSLAALAGSMIYCCGAYLLAEVPAAEVIVEIQDGWPLTALRIAPDFFKNPGSQWVFPFAVVAMSIVVFAAQQLVSRWRNKSPDGYEDAEQPAPSETFGSLLLSLLKTMIAMAVLSLLLLLPGAVAYFLMLPIFPVVFLWTHIMTYEKKGLFTGIARTTELLSEQFGQIAGAFSMLNLCGIMALLIFDAGVLSHLLNIIAINFNFSPAGGAAFSAIGYTFMVVFAHLVILALGVAASSLGYFSAMEAKEAFFLKQRLEMIGKRARIRGLEREA